MCPEARDPRVLVLRCRACHATLPAASNDLAFRCGQCGRGWEIGSAGLSERLSAHLAAPTDSSRSILYLPYWSFGVTASAEPKDQPDEPTLRARDRANKTRRAWVGAYSVYRPTYVGEWGLNYTRIQPEWKPIRGHGPASPGATISSEDATMIARHYILQEIDRAADLGSLNVDVRLGDPELWAIPCYDLGSQVRCPWTRAELPAAALDDLSQIRGVSGEPKQA